MYTCSHMAGICSIKFNYNLKKKLKGKEQKHTFVVPVTLFFIFMSTYGVRPFFENKRIA